MRNAVAEKQPREKVSDVRQDSHVDLGLTDQSSATEAGDARRGRQKEVDRQLLFAAAHSWAAWELDPIVWQDGCRPMRRTRRTQGSQLGAQTQRGRP